MSRQSKVRLPSWSVGDQMMQSLAVKPRSERVTMVVPKRDLECCVVVEREPVKEPRVGREVPEEA
jgi:hypothetical protein